MIDTWSVCDVCGTNQNLHEHHVFPGNGVRKQSEKYGMKVILCQRHHTGEYGIHHYKEMDLMYKQKYQRIFEQDHTREEFIKKFGRSWL